MYFKLSSCFLITFNRIFLSAQFVNSTLLLVLVIWYQIPRQPSVFHGWLVSFKSCYSLFIPVDMTIRSFNLWSIGLNFVYTNCVKVYFYGLSQLMTMMKYKVHLINVFCYVAFISFYTKTMLRRFELILNF